MPMLAGGDASTGTAVARIVRLTNDEVGWWLVESLSWLLSMPSGEFRKCKRARVVAARPMTAPEMVLQKARPASEGLS